MEQGEKFDSWAIVEVFGHQRFAGRVTEQAFGGTSFVRVDVPDVNGSPAFTKFFGGSAIYSITPVTEDLARKAVKACHSEPISVYIPADRQIERATDRKVVGPHPCGDCGSDCYCITPKDCMRCGKCDPDDDNVEGDEEF